MFETLFIRPSILGKYLSAPLFEERLRYLLHCEQTGFRRSQLRKIAAHQVHLVHLLPLQAGDRVPLSRIRDAAGKWSMPGGRRSSRPAQPDARQRFIGHAVRWLRFADRFEEPFAERHGHDDTVAAFVAWMRTERGWAEDTIRSGQSTVDRFFHRLAEPGMDLASIGIADIDRVIAHWSTRGCRRITIHDYAQRLRTFFRFAERQGWCTPGLAEGILPTRFQADETVPKGLDREEVLRLLATTEGPRPADLRDRAILMVLIAYGLRAGEVSGLQLDDLDWENERLTVRCPKPGRTHLYPLSRGVGPAVCRYLQAGRPSRADRSLFWPLSAPIRPLSRTGITHVVSSRLDRLGLSGKRRGPHALRHGTAQHLLDQGLSMKEIGDYLGHRSVSATSVYARVNLGLLREVAQIDLEGLA